MKPIILMLFIAAGLTRAAQEPVIKFNGGAASLQERWDRAVQTLRQGDVKPPAWIGYSIRRMMAGNSWIGQYDGDEQKASLRDLIEGRVSVSPVKAVNGEGEGLHIHSDGDSPEKEIKEVAILFKISRLDDRWPVIASVKMTNLDIMFDMEGLPLVWLEHSAYGPSLDLLAALYRNQERTAVREDLIAAIGLHDGSEQAGRFLKNIIETGKKSRLRAKAVFWLAVQGQQASLEMLQRLAEQDADVEVAGQAVFGLSLIKSERAVDALIALARQAGRKKIRRKAMFWLSQQAGEKAARAIEDVVYDEAQTDLQKQALFALSQLPQDMAVPRLIKVLRTHPNAAVRKKAVFWLGQCDDERALQAIVDMLKAQPRDRTR